MCLTFSQSSKELLCQCRHHQRRCTLFQGEEETAEEEMAEEETAEEEMAEEEMAEEEMAEVDMAEEVMEVEVMYQLLLVQSSAASTSLACNRRGMLTYCRHDTVHDVPVEMQRKF
ncbi:hypothetical protein CYMTET_3058 [Cymbomonas tetramitiformis]|uniref:Uncharacterized protein n=1 Tax=Cymbomonas tetramitiformis TaxID=36881 RepID=A0AAE0H3W1_9CHLO|nr:hypothetical protein CYMTET_3058 [Cymbomonas tetramitiformis]